MYDTVRIKKRDITGTIVDIRTVTEEVLYTVESNVKGKADGGYGDVWPLFDCYEDELETV